MNQLTREETLALVRNADYLRSIFDYDQHTGILRWNSTRHFRNRAAGSITADGYIEVTLHKKTTKAHHIIWCMMTGDWPDHQVDHINRVRTDNRWCNLRKATNLDNSRNRSLQRNNTSGYTGVIRTPYGTWAAKIYVKKRIVHLGTFKDKERAADAYRKASLETHGAFSRFATEVQS